MPNARTSLTHPLRIDALPIDGIDGMLGLTLCPGKTDPYSLTGSWNRDLIRDMEVIIEWGACGVVSLIEDLEFDILRVPDLGAVVKKGHMAWYHLPIKDTMVPDVTFEKRWNGEEGRAIKALLTAGEKVLLHCRGGLGRAGTVAAKLLIEFGYSPDRAISSVRKARHGAIENKLQESYFYSLMHTTPDEDLISNDDCGR